MAQPQSAYLAMGQNLRFMEGNIMKKYLNGKIVEMSETEIAELKSEAERMAEELKNAPPTEADRLEAVEMAILELAEVLTNG